MEKDLKTFKMGSPEDTSNFINAVIDRKAYTKLSNYIDQVQNRLSRLKRPVCGSDLQWILKVFVKTEAGLACPSAVATKDLLIKRRDEC